MTSQYIHENDHVSLQIEALGFVAVQSSFEEPLPEYEEKITHLRIIPNEKCFQNYPIEFGSRCIFQVLNADYNFDNNNFDDDKDFACLRYGQQVKLKQVSSEAFLVGSDVKYNGDSDDDGLTIDDSFSILLVHEDNLSTQDGFGSWVIAPRYRYREYGDSVYNGDNIIFICNHHRANQKCMNSINMSPNPFQFDHLLGLSANTYHIFSGFVIRSFNSYELVSRREKEHMILHHDIVRIDHIEADGVFACGINDKHALSSLLFPFAEMCDSRKGDASQNSLFIKKKVSEETTSLSYWYILPEIVTSHCSELFDGDCIRLRNLVTGHYLGVKCDDDDYDNEKRPDHLFVPTVVGYPDSRETIFIVSSADCKPEKSGIHFKDNLFLKHKHSGSYFAMRKKDFNKSNHTDDGDGIISMNCSQYIDDSKGNIVTFVKLIPQFIRDIVYIQQCSSIVGLSTQVFQITWETNEINEPFFRHFLITLKSMLKWISNRSYLALVLPPSETVSTNNDNNNDMKSSLSFWLGNDEEAIVCQKKQKKEYCSTKPHVSLGIKNIYLEFLNDIKNIPIDDLKRKQDILHNSRLIFHLINFLEVTFNCSNCFSIGQTCRDIDESNLSNILSDCFQVIQLIVASFVYHNRKNARMLLGINGYLMTTILQSIHYPICSPLDWLLKTVFDASREDQDRGDCVNDASFTLISAQNLHLLVNMMQNEVLSCNFTAAAGILNALVSLCYHVRPGCEHLAKLKQNLFNLVNFSEGASIPDAYETEVQCAFFSCRRTKDNKWEISAKTELIVEENLTLIDDDLTAEIQELRIRISAYADMSWEQKLSLLLKFGFSGSSLYECMDHLEFCDNAHDLCAVICKLLSQSQSYKYNETMLSLLLDAIDTPIPNVYATNSRRGVDIDIGNGLLTIDSPVELSVGAHSTDFGLWSVERDGEEDKEDIELRAETVDDYSLSVFDSYLYRFKQCLKARFPHFTFQGAYEPMSQASIIAKCVIEECVQGLLPSSDPELTKNAKSTPIWTPILYLFSSNCRDKARKDYVKRSFDLLSKLCHGKKDNFQYHVSKLLPPQLLIEILLQPISYSDRQTLYQLLLELYVEDDCVFPHIGIYSACSTAFLASSYDDRSISADIDSIGLLFENHKNPYNMLYLWDPSCLRLVFSKLLISDFVLLNIESVNKSELDFNNLFLRLFCRLLQKGFFEKEYSFEGEKKKAKTCLSIFVEIQQILTTRKFLPDAKEVIFGMNQIMILLVEKLTTLSRNQRFGGVVVGDSDINKSHQHQLGSALEIVKFIFDSTQFEEFKNIMLAASTTSMPPSSTHYSGHASLHTIIYSKKFTAMLLLLLSQANRFVQESITYILQHQISICLERFSDIQIVPTIIDASIFRVIFYLKEIIRRCIDRLDSCTEDVAVDVDNLFRYVYSTITLVLSPREAIGSFSLEKTPEVKGDHSDGDWNHYTIDAYAQLDHYMAPLCLPGSEFYTAQMFTLLLNKASAIIVKSMSLWHTLRSPERYLLDRILNILAFLATNSENFADQCYNSPLALFSLQNFNNCDGCNALLNSILHYYSFDCEIYRADATIFTERIIASINNWKSSLSLASARAMNTILAASYAVDRDRTSWLQDTLATFLLSPTNLSRSGAVQAIIFSSELFPNATNTEEESLQLYVLQSLAHATHRGTHAHSLIAEKLRAMFPLRESNHFLRSSSMPLLFKSAITMILSRIYLCDEFEFDQIISLNLQRISQSTNLEACPLSVYDYIFNGALKSIGYFSLYSCKYDPVVAYLNKKVNRLMCSDKVKEELKFMVFDRRVKVATCSDEKCIHNNYDPSLLSSLMIRCVCVIAKFLRSQKDRFLLFTRDSHYLYGYLLIICSKCYLYVKESKPKESKLLQNCKECVPKLLQLYLSRQSEIRQTGSERSRGDYRSDLGRVRQLVSSHEQNNNDLASTNIFNLMKQSVDSNRLVDNILVRPDAVCTLVDYFSSDLLNMHCTMNIVFLRILCSFLDNTLEDIRGNKELSMKAKASLLLTEAARLKEVQTFLVERGCLRVAVRILAKCFTLAPHTGSQHEAIPPIAPLALSLMGLLMANRNGLSKKSLLSIIQNANAKNIFPDKFCFAYLRVILHVAKKEIEGKRDCNFKLLVEMFSFVHKLSDDFNDYGRIFLRQQFVEKSSYYNSVSINIVQDLTNVASALLVLTMTKLKYLNGSDFYHLLHSTKNMKFVDWFDDGVDYKFISTLLFTLTHAFKALKNVAQGDFIENKVIIMTGVIRYLPPLVEYIGSLRTVVVSTSANGRKYTWDGGNPYNFCVNYQDAMRLGRKFNENEFMREQKKILKYVTTCGDSGQLYGGIAMSAFTHAALDCEKALVRLLLTFVERTNDNSIMILESSICGKNLAPFIANTETSLVNPNPNLTREHSEVGILYYSFLSTMQKITQNSTIKTWVSHNRSAIRAVCGSVEIIDKDGNIRVCFFPILPFVQEFRSYPETRLLRTKILYSINRATPEEKMSDFYDAMHSLIAVMKRQEWLRSLLSPPIHALFGGKKAKVAARFPDLKSITYALTICLSVYYSFITSYGETSHQGIGRVHRRSLRSEYHWLTDFLIVWMPSFNIGSLVFAGKIAHTALNLLIVIRQIINIDSKDAKRVVFSNAWGIILLLTSAMCIISDNFVSLYTLHLFDIVFRVKVMSFLVTAIEKNITRIFFTLILAILFLYGFAVVSYLLMRNQYSFNGHYGCRDTFGQCFKNHLDYGFTSSPDWGYESINIQPTIKGNSEWYVSIFGSAYNLLYIILVNLVLQSIISGLIVDTFSNMRAENESREQDMKNRCFICGFDRDYFERKDISFQSHIRIDHNMWMYVWFYIHLDSEDPTCLTSLDDYILSQFRSKSTFMKVIPVRRCSV